MSEKFTPGQEVFWVTLTAKTGIARGVVEKDYAYSVLMRRPLGGAVYVTRESLTTSANVALQRASDMRLKRIASLEKQLARLKGMQIDVPS